MDTSRRRLPLKVSDAEHRVIASALIRQALAETTTDREEQSGAAFALVTVTDDLSEQYGMAAAFEALAHVRRVLATFGGAPELQILRLKGRLH